MPPRVLVTGFLPFGDHAVNPSALLAESCGRPFEIVEVSFVAVDAFLDRLRSTPAPDVLLMLGLRGGGTTLDLEMVARNHVGPSPDMRGEIRGPGPIDPAGPGLLTTTLFAALPPVATELFSPSDDAGCYLCNYIYYRALRLLPPPTRVGFVHVPPPEAMPLDEQRRRLLHFLAATEAMATESQPPMTDESTLRAVAPRPAGL